MKLFTFAFLALMVLAANRSFAQYHQDNPNLDQVPQYLRESIPAHTDAPLSSIVTVGNWDNFLLGVDFAESNMAENPVQPAWYFTAYNTNAPHNTQNGFDWAINTANFGATMAGDPVVAYDSLGNLFYENMYGNISGCKVLASTDNGVTWGSSVTAIAGNDKNWIACDQTAGPYANYVYTTMTNGAPPGNFARSTNHGATFTSTFAPTTQTLPGMMVCVGPQGNIQGGAVYVVTNSGSSYASTYTFYRSNDGGATFVQQSAVQWPNYVGTYVSSRNSVQGMRTRPYPMIAADNSYGPSRGKLYCVYASNTPAGSGNKPDIFCRNSADGGATWSNAVQVNDDPNTTSNHQWQPSVWCDKQTGKLYVMWMDTRDTPTSDSACIYASYSADGGTTFAANQRISNAKMKIDCSTCGGGGTPRYQGDYNGIISNKKVSMVGWTDFRVGTFQSMTAYFPDFAMAIDHSTQNLYTYSDSATFQVSVPAVKLYTDTVLLSATISPTPSAGSITFSYPSGNSMTSYPNTKPVRVVLWGNVPPATYTATFSAAGPNGTPVHRRTATITVLAGTNPQAAVTLLPNHTACVGDTVHVPIHVTGTHIHNLALYVSYDHTNLTQTGTLFTSLLPSMTVAYNPAYNSTTLAALFTVIGTSDISLSNAMVIDLVFTVTGSGATALHLRKSPDTSPVCVLSNNAATQFIQVTYTDNTITPNTGPAVSVTIAANTPMPVCAGTSVSFTATPVNGGISPVYQWKVNGVNAGTNNPAFSYIPSNGDQVKCLLTSHTACATGNPATSNVITTAVTSLAPVSVSITASANPFNPGSAVTFTATPVNGGSSPSYQWQVNNVNVGPNNTVYSYSPLNLDVVACVLTSSLVCKSGSPAKSDTIVMHVVPVPQNTTIQNLNINETRCYNATQTITVSGNENGTMLVSGCNVTLIAGQNILFLPATTVFPGAHLLGYITPNGSYCASKAPSMVTVVNGAGEEKVPEPGSYFRVYPNPTSGSFILELTGEYGKGEARAEVYGSRGEKVLTRSLPGTGIHEFTLAGRPAGIYYLRIFTGNTVMVRKIILSN